MRDRWLGRGSLAGTMSGRQSTQGGPVLFAIFAQTIMENLQIHKSFLKTTAVLVYLLYDPDIIRGTLPGPAHIPKIITFNL